MKIEIDGCVIEYEHIVKPTATSTVVFIHGWGDSQDDMNATIPAISGTFNTLRFDLPGHGRSGSLPRYSLATYVAFVRALVERLGIKRPHVVGHSMGAAVATELHRQDEAEYPSIVLVDPPLKESTFGILLMPSLLIAEMTGGGGALLDLVVRDHRFQAFWCDRFVGPDVPEFREARQITIRGMIAADRNALLQGTFDSLTNAMICRPPRMSATFHVIFGQHDPLVDRGAVARLFRLDQVVEIPNAWHVPNRTSPEAFNAALLGILA